MSQLTVGRRMRQAGGEGCQLQHNSSKVSDHVHPTWVQVVNGVMECDWDAVNCKESRTMEMRVRAAAPSDLGAINDIYNHYVLHSTSTYQEEPGSLESRRAWFDRHDPRHPITVAELDGRVVGWGALSPFHARSAYRFTVENSVYVDHQHHRRGIGNSILADLIVRAQVLGHRTIIAGIDAS